MDSLISFVEGYWWLAFPLGWMLFGIFGMIGHYNHKNDVLKLIKSYADKGQEPPAALLDAMRGDESRAYDRGDYYGRRRWRHRYGWGGAVTFAALAAAFGYAGQYGHMGGETGTIFTALAIGFGIGAVFMLAGAVIRTFSTPRYDPRDNDNIKK